MTNLDLEAADKLFKGQNVPLRSEISKKFWKIIETETGSRYKTDMNCLSSLSADSYSQLLHFYGPRFESRRRQTIFVTHFDFLNFFLYYFYYLHILT